jgi:hypothetical protein
MSFTPNEFINTHPEEQIRCQQHAARLFTDDQFRLLPKNKFLYHVAFNINWAAVRSKTNITVKLLETLKDEVNLLVKSVDLPAYTVQTDVLNQYNRKKVAQYTHKYTDVGLSFNDDSMGLINQLWQTYYRYYYADPNAANAKGAYSRTATRPASFITSPYGYNGPTASFFNYVTIYQMARHEFVSYKLVNPVITSWTGGKLGYAEYGPHNFDMRLAYESVYYDVGYVDSGKMEGFGSTHYDWSPSPLTSNNYPRNISTSPSFPRTTLGSTNKTTAAAKAVTAAATASTTSSKASVSTAATTPAATTGGVNGVVIPQSTATKQTTVASSVKLSTAVVTAPTTATNTAPAYTTVI